MKKHQYFGTDGIRGCVGEFPITPDFVLKLGWAVGCILSKQEGGGSVLIGKDTRISGYMFESALEAGLSAAGMNVYLLGPMPTPAVAYLTRTFRAQAGIVISASHNSYQDNGIKFFSSSGVKLSDELEMQIETQLGLPLVSVPSGSLGKAARIIDADGRYIEFCKRVIPQKVSFRGLKIVLDCANGATYHIAPNVFEELGAEVVELAVNPDGLNINKDCGATNPTLLSQTVVSEKAALGIALDGDGDRLIMVDHTGEVIDGDQIIFIIARSLHEKGRLHGGIVGTLMSNYGLEMALKDNNIDFVRTQVGDRHVMSELFSRKWVLGGEASGHIINLDLTTTGDGIISALQVLLSVIESGKSVHELKLGMKKLPQVLLNINVSNVVRFHQNDRIQMEVKSVEKILKGEGRVVLRPSGTEPVIRVMVEGVDSELVSQLAERLAEVVKAELD